MKTYQYDTVGDILNELFEIKQLLKVIAGVESAEHYIIEEANRHQFYGKEESE